MKQLIVSQAHLSAIRDGILKGIEVASGARSSATYYHSREAQKEAVRQAIIGLYTVSKELPLLLATQKGATGFFISEVLLHEFKQTTWAGACNVVNPSDWYDEGLGNKLVRAALYNLDTENGIPYVLRLFASFKEHKINNRRSRHMALSYLWNHPTLEYVAVKYRSKYKAVLKHLYGEKLSSILVSIAKKYLYNGGVFESEKEAHIAEAITAYSQGDISGLFKIYLFVMGEAKAKLFDENEFPIINAFFKAKQDVVRITTLPEEVLLGLIGDVKHPQYVQLWATPEKRQETKATFRKKVTTTTVNRQLRQTKSNEKLGVASVLQVDVKEVTDFMALYKTGYETGFNPGIMSRIDELGRKSVLKEFPYAHIGILVDNSISTSGHKGESKNTPKAIISFTSKVLSYSAESYQLVETEEAITDLASAFLELLDKPASYDAIFILSDGYENAYDGLLSEVITAWKKISGAMTPIYHVSPITSAEATAGVRSLGENISTVAVSKPESLMMQLNAKLLEQDTKRWLENSFRYLEESEVKRKIKAGKD